MHEQRPLGQATLILADDQFINGYQAGHLRYMLDYRIKLLSDDEIYHFLATSLLTPLHPPRWNAGYIVGWIITMHEKKKTSIVPSILATRQGCDDEGAESTTLSHDSSRWYRFRAHHFGAGKRF